VSPYRIELTREERQELVARARRYTSPYRDVVRAKLVLLAAQGVSNDVIAARLDLPRQVVCKWRQRFWRYRAQCLAVRVSNSAQASAQETRVEEALLSR
jgi:transposase